MAHRECPPGATITSTASQQTLCDQQTPTHQPQTQQPQNPQAERPSQQEDQRTVHLIVYNSPLFRAHWGLLIPARGSSTKGKLIHVTGNVLRGFEHEFKRNYDVSHTTRPHRVVVIGHVADHIIVDVPGNGESSTDTTPHDNLERIALGVPAPGPSLNSVSNPVCYATLASSSRS